MHESFSHRETLNRRDRQLDTETLTGMDPFCRKLRQTFQRSVLEVTVTVGNWRGD